MLKKLFFISLFIAITCSNAFAQCNKIYTLREIADIANEEANEIEKTYTNPVVESKMNTLMLFYNKRQNIDNSQKFIQSEIEKTQISNFDLSQIKENIYKDKSDISLKNQERLKELKEGTYAVIQIDATQKNECSGEVELVKEKN